MCGRPLTEAAEAADAAWRTGRTTPEAEKTLQLPDPAIGFGNPHALRAAYLPALMAAFLSHLPFLNLLFFLWYPAAGFFSVPGYRRRTGHAPTMAEGAKLGAITGAMSFTISLTLGALSSLFPADRPDFSELLRQQMEQTPVEDEIRRQVLDLIDNPTALAALLVLALLVSLAFTIGLTTAGGALGAKVLDDN